MLSELVQSFLVEIVVLVIGMIAGSFLEDRFDFIGRGRRNRLLKKNVDVALDCVGDAETEIGSGQGREKLKLAIELYQERTGEPDYGKAYQAIVSAFQISTLSKNG